MKRAMFFWLERLKISPFERRVITGLLALLFILKIIHLNIRSGSPFDESVYSELEQEFALKTAILRQKEQQVMARYNPTEKQEVLAVADTIPAVEKTYMGKEIHPAEPMSKKIDLNTADAKTLESLPGIGPVYAQRMIKYREEKGSFTSYEQLLEIKGIGKKRLEKLKPFIKLKSITATQ